MAGQHSGNGHGEGLRVVVADAQRLFGEALAAALHAEAGFQVPVGCPTTGSDTIDLIERVRPDVSLVDFWLPDMDGAAVVRAVQARSPGARVLVLSWFHGPGQINAAMEAGAAGFLPKGLSLVQVIDAVHRAAATEGRVYARELAELVRQIEGKADEAQAVADRFATLTARELDILRFLNEGLSMTEVGEQLGIKAGTVKNHLHKILAKTKSGSRAEALAAARRLKLLKDMHLPPHPPHAGPHWIA